MLSTCLPFSGLASCSLQGISINSLFVFLIPNDLLFNACVTGLLYATWKKLENNMETEYKRSMIIDKN